MSEPQVNWKTNLVLVWICQFLSITSFGFALPFAPFYMQQELGVIDRGQLELWVGIFNAAAPLSLAIFSPIWGMVADRYGRRAMLLRAYCGTAVLLASMSLVTSVQQLVLLRLLQGVLTGTVTASQTLVSVHTPENRTGLALGSLSAAVFSGFMAGSFFGGVFSEAFGYRMAFYAAGAMMLLAVFITVFGVRDKLVKPEKRDFRKNFKLGYAQLIAASPILLLLVYMAFTRQFDRAFLPLLVQDIHGKIEGAALWTGSLSATCGIAGLLAGIIIGRLADKYSPAQIGKWSALLAGLLMIPMGLTHGFVLLFIARFGVVFFAGGLDPVFQVWLAKVTPKKSRGFVFGWAATAKAAGWMMAPLCSGICAALLGLRTIYFIGGGLFFILIFVITIVVKKVLRDQEQSVTP